MSVAFKKIKYTEQGEYGSTEEKYLYFKYDANNDITMIYDNDFNLLMTITEWGSFSMNEALITALSSWVDERMENLNEFEFKHLNQR